jgi:hypothetical protein
VWGIGGGLFVFKEALTAASAAGAAIICSSTLVRAAGSYLT